MTTIIVMLIINSVGFANNYAITTVQGFSSMETCLAAAQTVEEELKKKTICMELPK